MLECVCRDQLTLQITLELQLQNRSDRYLEIILTHCLTVLFASLAKVTVQFCALARVGHPVCARATEAVQNSQCRYQVVHDYRFPNNVVKYAKWRSLELRKRRAKMGAHFSSHKLVRGCQRQPLSNTARLDIIIRAEAQ
jgi:hypothetical protein